MHFETIKSDGLAHLSYMIGDNNQCAVIDPRRDIEAYLEVARDHEVEITHIVETHVHADFVSGSRELAARTGATIYGGQIENQTQGDYGFDIETLQDGDTLQVGDVELRALHTPGHSSEHMSFVVSGGGAGAEHDWAVFTGDTLFAGEVGRPDLEPGADHQELARKLFDSLHDKLMALDDSVEVYPCHGEGSPCGSSIGARDQTTIGYERRYNPRLQQNDKEEFVSTLTQELEEEPMPAYYARCKRINHDGPQILGALHALEAYDVGTFERFIDDDDVVLLDAREIEAFAAAHIPGSLNIALRGAFPVWAGRLLDDERRYVLIGDDSAAAEQARTHLLRIGLNLEGYLAGGFKRWFNAGKSYDSLELMSVHELYNRLEEGEDGLQILDVRTPKEWKSGHLQDAQHVFVPDLPDYMSRLDRERPVLTYCGSGFRASIAASMLAAGGFSTVYNLPGSMAAWKAEEFPLVEER
jgi:hydroxyacylglutathione hydrolase